jgi:hypothetical protein
MSMSRLGKAIESVVTVGGGSLAAPPSHRQVTLHLDGTRVRLVTELDDVQAPHDLHHLDLHAIRALATTVHASTTSSPSRVQSLDEDPARVLGQLLYRALLTGRVAIVLEQLLEESAREPDRVLRIHLQLSRTAERLETLPWELLCGPPGPDADALALRRDIRLTLGVSAAAGAHPSTPADGELRAVVLDADDSGPDLAPALEIAASRGASVQVVDASSPTALRDAASAGPQLVHVVGRFEPLQWPEPARVNLSALVQDLPFALRSPPVLVVLEDRTPGGTAVRETALGLLTTGVPDVLVLSAPTRRDSMPFLNAFYDALIAGDRIEDAVVAGRRADRYAPPGAGAAVSVWTTGDRQAVVVARSAPSSPTVPPA